MVRSADACPALTFRLSRRRYAIPLAATSGVRDLGPVRRIPDAPEPWYGLTDWGDGHVLNVLDLPALLRDRAVDPVRSIIRLRAPHDDVALFVPAHLGLGEWVPPAAPVEGAAVVALNAAVHWIQVHLLVPLGTGAVR